MTKTNLRRKTSAVPANSQKPNGWAGWAREALYGFKEVESVYYTIDNELIDVWVVIPERELSLLRQIIDVEMKFLDKFDAEKRSRRTFDFHIIYRSGAPESSLIPSGAVRL